MQEHPETLSRAYSRPFCRLLALSALGLFAMTQAQAQAQALDRLHPVLSALPLDGATVQIKNPRLAVRGASIYLSDFFLGRVFEFSLDQETTTLIGGCGFDRPSDPSSALTYNMSHVGPICPTGKNELLVTFRDRVFKLSLGSNGNPAKVERFAGFGGYSEYRLDKTSALKSSFTSLDGIIQRKDGSTILTDSGHGTLFEISPDGTVRDLFGDRGPAGAKPAQAFEGYGLLEQADGSLLVINIKFNDNKIMRIDPKSGEVTVFAGNHEPLPAYGIGRCFIRGLAQGPDASVLLLVSNAHPERGNIRILRLKNGQVTLLAGSDPGDHPRDPNYLPFDQGLNASARDLASLPDGSILLGSNNGVWLLAPADTFQNDLQALVDRGRDALRNHLPDAYHEAEQELIWLGIPTKDSLAALNKEGQNSRLGNKAGASVIYNDLVRMITAFGDSPTERFRAHRALATLRAFRDGLANSASSHSSSPGAASSK
jgi:hypothetical protein